MQGLGQLGFSGPGLGQLRCFRFQGVLGLGLFGVWGLGVWGLDFVSACRDRKSWLDLGKLVFRRKFVECWSIGLWN